MARTVIRINRKTKFSAGSRDIWLSGTHSLTGNNQGIPGFSNLILDDPGRTAKK
jgi:hypothetical protein